MPRASTISKLAEFVPDQWGLVTRRQAEAAGVSRATMTRLASERDRHLPADGHEFIVAARQRPRRPDVRLQVGKLRVPTITINPVQAAVTTERTYGPTHSGASDRPASTDVASNLTASGHPSPREWHSE